MSTETADSRLARIDSKTVGRVLTTILIFSALILAVLFAFAMLGRRGTMGSLALFLFVGGMAMTAVHHGLKRIGW